jgi:trk system potassium uptake protein TrkA
MKQFAIIGLGIFGRRVLEELLSIDCEILIIDKSREVIDYYKDKATHAYVADAINEEIIRKLVPDTIDAAIVDLGDKIEVSILVTNYLKKAGIRSIVAKAESDEHGEILGLVGASRVVFPNREAAKRIAPMLFSSLISSYLPLSTDFVIAEVKPPPRYIGLSLIQSNLRKEYQLNVIAVRKESAEDYNFFSPEYVLREDDIFLIAGNESNLNRFAQVEIAVPFQQKEGVRGFFKRFFNRLRL